MYFVVLKHLAKKLCMSVKTISKHSIMNTECTLCQVGEFSKVLILVNIRIHPMLTCQANFQQHLCQTKKYNTLIKHWYYHYYH